MKAMESPAHSTARAQGAALFTFSYLLALVIGALAIVVFFGATLVSLGSAGYLPPPQISNHLCLDEKLRFLRSAPMLDTPGYAPEVLAVGSSVTWRSLDGEAIEGAMAGRGQFFNGGFCGLKIHETGFTTRYFLEKYPSVREVVTVLAPQDLTGCSTTDSRVFDAKDADRYISGDAWVFPLYLKYFDPFTFAKNAYQLYAKDVFRWDGGYDRFAGFPMDTSDRPQRLIYGRLEALDPACFDALRDMALELRAEGRRLIVATMPMNPAWFDRYDPAHELMPRLAGLLQAALAGTSATLWDAQSALTLQREDFLDAIHIRWSAAREFSRVLVRDTGLGRASIPE